MLDLALVGAEQHSPRLNVIYFKGVDRASHIYWKYLEPDHEQYRTDPPSAEDVANYGGVIHQVYRHTDELLGKIVERLRPRDVLLLVSDHGFGAIPARGRVSGGHGIAPDTVDGIYVMAGGPIRGETCPAEISLFDVAPTLLYLLGLEVPKYVEGTVVTALFDPVFLEQHPVEWTDTVPVPGRAAETQETVPDENRRIERLRALGYLD